MRILIVANKMPYPAKDGGTIATLSLAMSLRKCGSIVDLLAMNTPKHYCNISDIPVEISSEIRFHAVSVDTTIQASAALKNLLFSTLPYNAERFISKDFEKKLCELLSENIYDVVQLEGLYLCPYIPAIRKYTQAKVALRTHNVEHEIWQRMVENEKSLPKKWYKRIIAKRMRSFELAHINSYDCLVPITERDADFFSQNGNAKPTHVVQSGLEPESPLFAIDNAKADFPGFSYLGALDWQPNCEGLIWFIENVWKKYADRHPGAKFRVAGRNADKEFEKFLISSGVDYRGELENVVDCYASGAIFVVPLFSGSGMRIKIVEAMAAGKTVITTPLGTEGIATENAENILIADNADQFLQCMENIEADRGLHEKISANARLFVRENYDNSVIAKKLLDFYSSINRTS